jgi:hypothetical protein
LQTKSTKTIIGIDSAGIEGRNTHLPGEALSTTGWLWQGVSRIIVGEGTTDVVVLNRKDRHITDNKVGTIN